jgi:DNA mismatch repair protein MutS
MDNPERSFFAISLLWPDGPRPYTNLRQSRGAADLGLEALAAALSIGTRYSAGIRNLLAALCDAPDVISYRHAILDDLLNCPALAAGLEAALPMLVQLADASDPQRPHQTFLHQAVSRLGELELYVDCIRQLRALFGSVEGRFHSAGLRQLHQMLVAREADPAFQSLAAELPALSEKMRNVRSISVGINLSPQLQPVAATLLSISSERYRGASKSLLGKLLGTPAKDEADEYQGLAEIHSLPLTSSLPHGSLDGSGEYVNPMLVPLFRDLNDILQSVARPVVKALGRYIKLNGQFVIALEGEIAFYLGACRLIQRVRAAGLPLCRPEVLGMQARVCEVQDTYNLNFALRLMERQPGADLSGQVVTNDVAFNDAGRIFILTGPNQGGKTTYTQAVGLIQVLCQAGLYVPGTHARISPVDGIYTHFPVEERPSLEAGRLGEEAKRLSDIFAQATRNSLVLLNESLASTSPGEGLYLARDVLRALKLLGARVIFATHLHELAGGLQAGQPGGVRRPRRRRSPPHL